MKRTNTLLLISAALVVTVFSGCNKYVHENIQAASNSSVAISTLNDVFEQMVTATSYEESLDGITDTDWFLHGTLCADVSLTPSGANFPKTLTIDYGNGCIGADGVSRSGIITAQITGNLDEEGSAITLIFDGFSNGQYSISGKDSITTLSADGDGNPVYSEVHKDIVVSWGTQQILWDADLTRTWLEGDTTNFTTDTVGGTLQIAGLNDDVFSLMGTAEGNDSNTHPFTLEITQSVVLPTDCKWITDGMLTVSPTNYNTGTVDYGNGKCNKQATLEVEGEVFNFTL